MILLSNQKKEDAIKHLQSAKEDDQNPIYQEKAKKVLHELENN